MNGMNPGHENCTAARFGTITIDGPGEVVAWCHHEHKEHVTADSGVGDPVNVGWHCHCCGSVFADNKYVNDPHLT